MIRRTATYYSARRHPAYPNAADSNYYKKKAVELSAGLLSGVALTLSIIMLTMFT